jgi:DNA polymerase I-like protein with 3'-5' exonuclease and polymerase domains
MFSCDTETTGLHWQHGTVAFAIGICSEDSYWQEAVQVDPQTRMLMHDYSQDATDKVRAVLYGDQPVVFQNANFDIKALCRSGLIGWNEPDSPEFWETILELGHLVHLNNSTDAGHKASLKKLTPAYLDKDYSSMDELDRIVNRCRNFIRHRDVNKTWFIATQEAIPYVTSGHNKMDMWLPAALRKFWGNQDELQEYMGEDYSELATVVDKYLRDDCENTLALGQMMMGSLLNKYNPAKLEELLSMNRDLHPVIWKIETRGIPVHRGALDTAMDICRKGIKECHDRCNEISGLDLETYTDTHLRELLIDRFGLKSPRLTPKGMKPSVDAKARVAMMDIAEGPALEFLQSYEQEKTLTTKLRYLTSYSDQAIASSQVTYDIKSHSKDTEFLFPRLNSVGTQTTRFSSSNPNAQNIGTGKEIPCLRSVFRPEPGRWWFPIDYSQLQLRIFAAATKDAALIQSFEDGYDFHDFMAKQIFPDQEISKEQRRIAKNTNFGFIFGASERKIDQTAGIPGLYKHLMQKFPGAKRFIQETKRAVEVSGRINTLGGYPIHLPLTTSPWGVISYPAHLAVNYLVQGTEGEIVKRAMFLVDQFLTKEYPDARIVMNIHDEIIIDTPARPPKHIVRSVAALMEEAGLDSGVITPVDVEVCVRDLSERQEVEL